LDLHENEALIIVSRRLLNIMSPQQPSNEIIVKTILDEANLTFCETAGAAETVDMYIDDGGGGTDYEILSDQAVGANETFEHTGRIVLVDEDHLVGKTASSAAVDVVISYLDQTR